MPVFAFDQYETLHRDDGYPQACQTRIASYRRLAWG